jgi:hypothetical protein
MTTFDPNSITPSGDFMRGLISKTNYKDACILSARWGAEQAVYALRHQWPEPITDRPPTKEDADECGFVQYLFCGKWNFDSWDNVAKNQHQAWLHTTNWQPKPEPTLQVQALNILEDSIDNTRGDGWAEISPDNVRKLREALLSIPGEVLQVPHIHDGNIEYTWKE